MSYLGTGANAEALNDELPPWKCTSTQVWWQNGTPAQFPMSISTMEKIRRAQQSAEETPWRWIPHIAKNAVLKHFTYADDESALCGWVLVVQPRIAKENIIPAGVGVGHIRAFTQSDIEMVHTYLHVGLQLKDSLLFVGYGKKAEMRSRSSLRLRSRPHILKKMPKIFQCLVGRKCMVA